MKVGIPTEASYIKITFTCGCGLQSAVAACVWGRELGKEALSNCARQQVSNIIQYIYNVPVIFATTRELRQSKFIQLEK